MDSSMSKMSKTSPKLFSIAILALFIVILPAGSWYYLKQGADYRKSLQDALLVKDEDTFNQLLSEKAISNGELIKEGLVGFTTLLVDDKETENKKLQDLLRQYADAYTFQLLKLKSSESVSKLEEEVLVLDDELYDSLFTDHTFYLVDIEGKLRNKYGNTDTDYNNIVQHIAVILPRTPEKDIKMKK